MPFIYFKAIANNYDPLNWIIFLSPKLDTRNNVMYLKFVIKKKKIVKRKKDLLQEYKIIFHFIFWNWNLEFYKYKKHHGTEQFRHKMMWKWHVNVVMAAAFMLVGGGIVITSPCLVPPAINYYNKPLLNVSLCFCI